MIHYKLDYAIERILQEQPSSEQIFLRKYANITLSKKDAKEIWERILDHKWYVSERLGRDVGFRVASIDYIENIKPQQTVKTNKSNIRQRFIKVLTPSAKSI